MDFLPGVCTPAKFFLVFQSISVIAKTFFPSKERPLMVRLKMLILAILLIAITLFVSTLFQISSMFRDQIQRKEKN